MTIFILNPVLTGHNSSEKTTWNKALSTAPYIKVAELHLHQAQLNLIRKEHTVIRKHQFQKFKSFLILEGKTNLGT